MKYFDLTPRGMIEKFDLLNGERFTGKYPKHSSWMNYPWEKTDKAKELKRHWQLKVKFFCLK